MTKPAPRDSTRAQNQPPLNRRGQESDAESEQTEFPFPRRQRARVPPPPLGPLSGPLSLASQIRRPSRVRYASEPRLEISPEAFTTASNAQAASASGPSPKPSGSSTRSTRSTRSGRLAPADDLRDRLDSAFLPPRFDGVVEGMIALVATVAFGLGWAAIEGKLQGDAAALADFSPGGASQGSGYAAAYETAGQGAIGPIGPIGSLLESGTMGEETWTIAAPQAPPLLNNPAPKKVPTRNPLNTPPISPNFARDERSSRR